MRVVEQFLMQSKTNCMKNTFDVVFTPELREHLAKEGFDPAMGARPMQRLIQDTIRRALADTSCCSAGWWTAVVSRWGLTTRARCSWYFGFHRQVRPIEPIVVFAPGTRTGD